MKTLWDLLPSRLKPAPPPQLPRVAPCAIETKPAKPKPQGHMAQRYEQMTRDMLKAHNVRVRKWRTSMSGVAWSVMYADGTVSRLIEAPRPKGPMSAAVFLHEIGHHAIGLGAVRPRCLEEYAAWQWALEEMERQGLNVTDRVHARVRESLRYAVWKARRRGLKRIPAELLPYLD